ncbi:hypothetical protein T484DRAFT_1755446 [Baffinella frigidus]|nr:hypothetical protein T484DRAFT_1755446 [Cryptophyta sp. CCMP2293]
MLSESDLACNALVRARLRALYERPESEEDTAPEDTAPKDTTTMTDTPATLIVKDSAPPLEDSAPPIEDLVNQIRSHVARGMEKALSGTMTAKDWEEEARCDRELIAALQRRGEAKREVSRPAWEAREAKMDREIQDILKQVHAETAAAMATDTAFDSPTKTIKSEDPFKTPAPTTGQGSILQMICPTTGTSCRLTRSKTERKAEREDEDNDDSEWRNKTPVNKSEAVLKGVADIRDFLNVIHDAEACTKFLNILDREIDAIDNAAKDPIYSQHALALVYTEIRRVARKICTITNMLLDRTVHMVVDAATKGISAEDSQLAVHEKRCEWCESVVQLAQNLMKVVDSEFSKIAQAQ